MDYVEQLCQAVDTIVTKRVEDISYDTTLTCTIIDDSQKKDGIYQVNNGSATFTAYSSNTTYSKGNVVYVQVPNGDWNEQKIILSKKPSDSDAPLSYIKPFDSFVDLSGNLILSQPKQQGLVANGQTISIPIWSYVGEPLVGYTRLGIRAGFQAWLKELGAVEGSYGLCVKINRDWTNTEEKYFYVLDFNCANMIGNPYNYESFFEQEMLFDVSGIEQIKEIVIELYQNEGSFLDINKERIPPRNEEEYKQYGQNIFVKDVYIGVGYDSSAFDSDAVVIFTWNDSQYEATTDPAEKDHKKIYLRWVHKFDDGSIRVVDKDDNLSYNLYWYRKVLGEASHIPQSGVDWRLLSQETAENGIEICDSDWVNYNTSSTIKREPAEGMTWLIPDVTTAEEKVKAIINLGDQYYNSNILTFTNKKEVISKPTVDAVQALSINCEDNSYGNYFIYKQGGQIVNQADASKVRTFRLHFDSAFKTNSEENQNAYLLEAESIEWIIPTKNTMIGLFSQSPEEDTPDDYVDRDGYRHIKKYGSVTDGYKLNGNNFYNYKINSYYSQSKNNNTIKCVVVKDKVTYTATKELTFGPTGTSGTDYTFVLDFDGNVNALEVGSNRAVTVTARLYDYEGQEVEGIEKTAKIEWDWASESTATYMIISSDTSGLKWNQTELQLKTNSVPTDNYYVLRATLSEWGDYDLQAYLPIPIQANGLNGFISGATTVCYNSLGTLDNISFYQNPYKLYVTTIENNIPIITNESEDSIIWELSAKNISTMTPELKGKTLSDGSIDYYLAPKSVYAEEVGNGICVSGYKEDKNYLWSQPIWIYQNKYPSSIVNEWNGELTINDKENAILAAKMIAGSKDSQNRFSGVMMGDWEEQDTETGITENTGIYGFHEGAASFGFRDDGTAFIGKSGSGRIEFDGSKSTITSASYSNGGTGIFIDLKTPEFIIKGTEKTLMDVGNSKYYLQSNNYNINNTNHTYNGTKINLQDGTLETNNGTFNGLIMIRNTGGTLSDLGVDNYATISLNSILSKLNANISSLSTQLKSIEALQTWQASAITTLSKQTTRIDDIVSQLSYYFGISEGHKGQTRLDIQSYSGGRVVIGDGVTLYSSAGEVYVGGNTAATGSTWTSNVYLRATEGIYSTHEITISSDRHLKKNINYNMEKYKQIFFNLKPVTYSYKNSQRNQIYLGFIAQDIQQLMQENNIKNCLISEQLSDNKYLSLNYNSIFTLNTYMLQEAYKEIDLLKQEVQELKEKIK